MKFLILSHVDHKKSNNLIYGYGPYIREMNLWIKNVDSVEVVANLNNLDIENIDLAYSHVHISFTKLESFNLISLKQILKTIVCIPKLLVTIYKAMKRADHIHLRCPGNVGLLGCIVQMLFPNKPKTAKYAGNWDPKSKQPWSYRLQQWILNNTFLTKNMQVLVYGQWEGTSKNIRPFFTATYHEMDAVRSKQLTEKQLPTNKENSHFVYIGTLSVGKRPLYALQLFHELLKSQVNATMSFYGEGTERAILEQYIQQHQLQDFVILHGNQNKQTVEIALQNAHFLILPSQSEGWPKVVAEAMFWGCVPLATNVSCVHEMMGYGKRGMLLNLDIEKDAQEILHIINNPQKYSQMSEVGKKWSTNYTIERFEQEIIKLL